MTALFTKSTTTELTARNSSADRMRLNVMSRDSVQLPGSWNPGYSGAVGGGNCCGGAGASG